MTTGLTPFVAAPGGVRVAVRVTPKASPAGAVGLALDAAGRADEGTEPPDDLNASPDFRRHLARVLVRRALEKAGA